MPNILDEIDDCEADLSSDERKIAQYISNSPFKIIQMDVQDLSQNLNLSTTVINQFCVKVTGKDFDYVKSRIKQLFPKQPTRSHIEIRQNESIDSLKGKLHSRAIEALNHCLKELDSEIIDQICSKLKMSNTIFVFGYGASYVSALDLYQKLSRLGLNIQIVQETHMLTTKLSTHSNKDCVIFITNNGDQSEMLAMAKVISDYHVPVITITSKETNSIVQNSEIVLPYGSTDENEMRMGATTSLFAQMYTIDVLFYRYIALNYSTSLDFITQSKMALDNYRKHLSNIKFKH